MTMTSTMTTTKTFLIIARASGQNLGIFEARTEDDAVATMIRRAGYRDAQHEAEVLQSAPAALRAELSVFEIDVPAIIAKLADAMVEQDRESPDCAEIHADVEAGKGCGWDRLGLVSLADDLSLGHEGNDREVARAIGEYRFSEVREAYAKAWREAVEADLADMAAEKADEDWDEGREAAHRAIKRGECGLIEENENHSDSYVTAYNDVMTQRFPHLDDFEVQDEA